MSKHTISVECDTNAFVDLRCDVCGFLGGAMNRVDAFDMATMRERHLTRVALEGLLEAAEVLAEAMHGVRLRGVEGPGEGVVRK